MSRNTPSLERPNPPSSTAPPTPHRPFGLCAQSHLTASLFYELVTSLHPSRPCIRRFFCVGFLAFLTLPAWLLLPLEVRPCPV